MLAVLCCTYVGLVLLGGKAAIQSVMLGARVTGEAGGMDAHSCGVPSGALAA